MLFVIESGNLTNQVNVNERIEKVWNSQATPGGVRDPIYFLFSISGSKQYCAMAEMIDEVNMGLSITGWPKADTKTEDKKKEYRG